jgi:hypothetical protein
VARRLSLSIGLLCSKTFDDAIFEDLFEAKYGLTRAAIKKINIKGVFQIWTHDGGYHEVSLKEGHAWTREGCKQCPDFAAEHADIATGGIGAFSDWTLTIVRTDQGREIMAGMIADGVVETRPGDDDPGAIELLRKLARVSRRRWPATADRSPSASSTLGTGQFESPGEDGVEHGNSQDSGERVLLAGVVRAEHDQAVRGHHFGPVAEPGAGPDTELRRHHLIGELAEDDDDPHPGKKGELAPEIGEAGVPFLRCRLVLRRGAAHGGGDIGAGQF